ncbi:hypothetical protein CLV63_11187 [Murinocardiopsis flavida]|uniref:Uncharacterized protein n=1 Tax=Murinocardiopsis flavida TaxID=645275 RepID=A0A2P8DGZ4_9ACTN|nr:hypothetical protein [Murinocardiopsis flavida]PSK96492.1 hypothetical protein CLV63_11187 [Murinocardiopsis flavida]
MTTPTAEVIRVAGADRTTGRWPVRRSERRAARRIARATRGKGAWTAAHAAKVRRRILAYLARGPVGARLAVVSFVLARHLERFDTAPDRFDADPDRPVAPLDAEVLSAYAALLREVAGRRLWHRGLIGGVPAEGAEEGVRALRAGPREPAVALGAAPGGS